MICFVLIRGHPGRILGDPKVSVLLISLLSTNAILTPAPLGFKYKCNPHPTPILLGFYWGL